MKSDKLILVLLFLFVSILIVEFALMQTAITKPKQLNAQVATVRFCVNHPPIIVPLYLFNITNGVFTCQIFASDDDDVNLTYSAYLPETNTTLNVSPTGFIQTDNALVSEGNYTMRVGVFDDSGCENNNAEMLFFLGIANQPPILIKNFTNQDIYNGLEDRLIYTMSSYFRDPENLSMSYIAYPTLPGLTWAYDSGTDIMTFTPQFGWAGILNVTIRAFDRGYYNTSSNNFTITIRSRPSVPPASGGGGKGGGGGSNLIMCMPKWICEDWGMCQPEGIRTRECIDEKNCNTSYLKPNTTEPCEFKSSCFDGIRGPDEEGIDCGGVCPPCGTCYDMICNNEEDCTTGKIGTPDCGGQCIPCDYGRKSFCYDSTCNGDEDCTIGLSSLPDCGGSCGPCPILERPKLNAVNWGFFLFLLLLVLLFAYTLRKAYPYLIVLAKRRKKRLYEERLMLETKIAESLLDAVNKLLMMLGKEDMDKIIVLFSSIVRKFFKNLLNLRYEFTYEELIRDIRSRAINPTYKKVLEAFFERTSEVEFSGKSVSLEEMKAMISEFKNMLSLTSLDPLKIEEMKIDLTNGSKIDRIYMMISGAESALQRKNLNSAYELYMRIHTAFHDLKPDEMKKIHGFITRLYEEVRLSREEYGLEEHPSSK